VQITFTHHGFLATIKHRQNIKPVSLICLKMVKGALGAFLDKKNNTSFNIKIMSLFINKKN
jgi:hypothetical protein